MTDLGQTEKKTERQKDRKIEKHTCISEICTFIHLFIHSNSYIPQTCHICIPEKKIKNDGNQKINLADTANFSFAFWVDFGNITSFLAYNDGNQLPGCQLFFQV